jgi:isopentenyl-diphosphate delta-isomerase
MLLTPTVLSRRRRGRGALSELVFGAPRSRRMGLLRSFVAAAIVIARNSSIRDAANRLRGLHGDGYVDGMSSITVATGGERVVLLDDDGPEVGSAAKAAVHHESTPLHLGFSCYLFDGAGRVLLTRRALGKQTWPGVWTNSFCGHPAPGEPVAEAVRRRARQELGVTVERPVCVLPRFRYRAVAADGTVENEVCPVFCARTDAAIQASADEIMDSQWVTWFELRSAAELAWSISPWAAEQIPLLEAEGLLAWTGPLGA